MTTRVHLLTEQLRVAATVCDPTISISDEEDIWIVMREGRRLSPNEARRLAYELCEAADKVENRA